MNVLTIDRCDERPVQLDNDVVREAIADVFDVLDDVCFLHVRLASGQHLFERMGALAELARKFDEVLKEVSLPRKEIQSGHFTSGKPVDPSRLMWNSTRHAQFR